MFKEIIGPAAVYEQLAEECDEMAKAVAKVARIIRGENPTPVTMDEAMKNLVEEFTDVQLVANDLNLRADKAAYDMKCQRWYDRLKEAGYVWKTETA